MGSKERIGRSRIGAAQQPGGHCAFLECLHSPLSLSFYNIGTVLDSTLHYISPSDGCHLARSQSTLPPSRQRTHSRPCPFHRFRSIAQAIFRFTFYEPRSTKPYDLHSFSTISTVDLFRSCDLLCLTVRSPAFSLPYFLLLDKLPARKTC